MSTRASAAAAVLLALTGCRGEEGSTTPGNPEPTAEIVESVVAPRPEPESKTEPKPVDDPEPKPVPKPVDTNLLRVADRTIAVRLDEQPAADEETAPLRTLVLSLDGATEGDDLLSLPTSFGWCYQTEAVVDPVPGVPSPLVFAQAFCTNGEDEFSREILSAVIHVGDSTTAPRVLWQGEGTYRNSFGLCEDIDIPTAEVTRAGVLVVTQLTEVIARPNPDRLGGPCKARKERQRKLAEIAF